MAHLGAWSQKGMADSYLTLVSCPIYLFQSMNWQAFEYHFVVLFVKNVELGFYMGSNCLCFLFLA
jgi:hypothetical protein